MPSSFSDWKIWCFFDDQLHFHLILHQKCFSNFLCYLSFLQHSLAKKNSMWIVWFCLNAQNNTVCSIQRQNTFASTIVVIGILDCLSNWKPFEFPIFIHITYCNTLFNSHSRSLRVRLFIFRSLNLIDFKTEHINRTHIHTVEMIIVTLNACSFVCLWFQNDATEFYLFSALVIFFFSIDDFYFDCYY